MNTIDFDLAVAALANLPVNDALTALETKLGILRNFDNIRTRDINELRVKRKVALRGGAETEIPEISNPAMRYRLVCACSYQFRDETKDVAAQILVLLAQVLGRCGLRMTEVLCEAVNVARYEAAKAAFEERMDAYKEGAAAAEQEDQDHRDAQDVYERTHGHKKQ